MEEQAYPSTGSERGSRGGDSARGLGAWGGGKGAALRRTMRDLASEQSDGVTSKGDKQQTYDQAPERSGAVDWSVR
jgi:hypothetical protein